MDTRTSVWQRMPEEDRSFYKEAAISTALGLAIVLLA
jgi:hypothetical protein